ARAWRGHIRCIHQTFAVFHPCDMKILCHLLTALCVCVIPLAADDAWAPTARAAEARRQLEKQFEGKGHRFAAFGFIAHAAKCDEKQFARTNRLLRTHSEFAAKNLFDKPP